MNKITFLKDALYIAFTTVAVIAFLGLGVALHVALIYVIAVWVVSG